MRLTVHSFGKWHTAALVSLCLLAHGVQRAAAGSDPAPAPDLVLEIRLERNSIYLGEIVPATVTLLVGQVSARNIGYPKINGNFYSVGEFAPPRSGNLTRSERAYSVYEFVSTLRPHRGGKLQIGPAEVGLELVEPGEGASAYFGGSEPRQIRVQSAPVYLSVLPLPAAGRPSGFGGAVGRFTVNRRTSAAEVHIGDPVSVITRIEGNGSSGSFSCVPIELPGVRSYPPRERRTASALTCDQVLIPERASELLIPPATISFFDPSGARYRIEQSEPVRVEILDAGMEPPPTVPTSPTPPAQGPTGGADPGRPYRLLLAMALLSALLGYLSWRAWSRSKASKTAPAPQRHTAWLAEAEVALEAGDPDGFHTAVYRALQNHLGARFGLTPTAITADIVAKVIGPAGTPEPLLRDYERLFFICDQARFAPASTGAVSMLETLQLLKGVLQRQ